MGGFELYFHADHLTTVGCSNGPASTDSDYLDSDKFAFRIIPLLFMQFSANVTKITGEIGFVSLCSRSLF